MPTKKKIGARSKDNGGTSRAKKAVRNILAGQSFKEAGINAGYSKSYMSSPIYKTGTADWIKEQVARRHREAAEKAGVHTDVIVGHLVEIMSASIADVMPDHPALQEAKTRGVDHLIKKMIFTPMQCGTKIVKKRDGSSSSTPVVKEKVELEMYSRLDAIAQLRDNFGMKQEPRANTFAATRQQEVEKSIQVIMDREKCDKSTAAKKLLEAIDSPQLIPFIEKYVC